MDDATAGHLSQAFGAAFLLGPTRTDLRKYWATAGGKIEISIWTAK